MTTATAPGYGPMHVKVPPTSRGGLLVHCPTRSTNDFLLFTNPLPPSTPHSWIQETLQQHGGTHRGGRRKRKLTLEETLQSPKRNRPPSSDDEYFLQYLQLRHQGNVDTAQLALLVASGAGRGECGKSL